MSINPFRSSIATDAWTATDVDVDEIHADDFEVCLAAVDYVREHQRSMSVLIYGQPGAGKTHLLSRVRAALVKPAAPGESARCEWFVNTLLKSAAGRVWRGFRRKFVDELLGKTVTPPLNTVPRNGRPPRPQLEVVVLRRIMRLRNVEGDLDGWWDYARDEENIEGVVNDLGELTHHPRLARVLVHWLLKRHVPLVKEWLRGDSLAESDLEKLGVSTAESPQPEEESAELVLALSRLAEPAPIVFCFDQLEALESFRGDDQGLFDFGQLISQLHRECSNAAILTCMQTEFIGRAKQAMGTPNYHRLRDFRETVLESLTLPQAERLIQARLQFHSGRHGAAAEFALPPKQLGKLVSEPGGLTPRRLLDFCSRQFDRVPDEPDAPQPTVQEFFETRFDEALDRKGRDPQSSQFDETLSHGLPHAIRLLTGTAPRAAVNDRDVDFKLKLDDGEVAVALCNQKNMTSLASRLKRLTERQNKGEWHKLVLLRHPQSPISRTAAATRRRLEELEEHGARMIHPSLEMLAALDALRELLAQAQSGDLAFQGQCVKVSTLEDWLRGALPECLTDLVDEIARPPAIVAPLEGPAFDDVAAYFSREYVASVESAAAALCCSQEELRRFAAANSDHFLLIAGTSPDAADVLCRVEAPVSC